MDSRLQTTVRGGLPLKGDVVIGHQANALLYFVRGSSVGFELNAPSRGLARVSNRFPREAVPPKKNFRRVRKTLQAR